MHSLTGEGGASLKGVPHVGEPGVGEEGAALKGVPQTVETGGEIGNKTSKLTMLESAPRAADVHIMMSPRPPRPLVPWSFPAPSQGWPVLPLPALFPRSQPPPPPSPLGRPPHKDDPVVLFLLCYLLYACMFLRLL